MKRDKVTLYVPPRTSVYVSLSVCVYVSSRLDALCTPFLYNTPIHSLARLYSITYVLSVSDNIPCKDEISSLDVRHKQC